MSSRFKKAGQAEIIRSLQKDSLYTRNLTEDLSDILKFGTKPITWIRYQHLCKFLAEISYFSFLSTNRLQTLGEEYTGIIQLNENCTSLPNRFIQFIGLILELGGESLYNKLLNKFENDVRCSEELRLEAKEYLLKMIKIMKFSVIYIKEFHKTWFYFKPNKYHLSKRIFGINYVLVRNWLSSNQSLYGFRILGFLKIFQLIFSLIMNLNKLKFDLETLEKENNKQLICVDNDDDTNNTNEQNGSICNLCLEICKDVSVTLCGHLFCWKCIIEWLNEKQECPVCRESIRKSNVIQLMNYR